MARKIVKEEVAEKKATRKSKVSELSVLVARWGEAKEQSDLLAKDVKKDGAQIKQIMMDNNKEDSTSGKYTAHLSYATSQQIDEEGLLEYIKSKIQGKKKSCPYIKTIEVIDYDALEKAIYNGEITKKQVLEMDKYKSEVKTPKLTLKIQKED